MEKKFLFKFMAITLSVTLTRKDINDLKKADDLINNGGIFQHLIILYEEALATKGLIDEQELNDLLETKPSVLIDRLLPEDNQDDSVYYYVFMETNPDYWFGVFDSLKEAKEYCNKYSLSFKSLL